MQLTRYEKAAITRKKNAAKKNAAKKKASENRKKKVDAKKNNVKVTVKTKILVAWF